MPFSKQFLAAVSPLGPAPITQTLIPIT